MIRLRHVIQFIFLASVLILVYGFKFNAEAYCPFGAVETAYTYLSRGRMLCVLGVGNIFAFVSVVIITLLFRRVFCGYICPIGAVSEGLRLLARKLRFRQIELPRKYHRVLSLMKYVVLVMVLVMTAVTVDLFYRYINPCQLFASVEEEVEFSAYIASGIFVVTSFLFVMPFCRWFCPFAAVQNVMSSIGLTRIVRNKKTCISCNKCSKSCPMNIDVANCDSVMSANCISCFECIDACPISNKQKQKPLQWSLLNKINIPNFRIVVACSILIAFTATLAASKFLDFPTFVYSRDAAVPDDLNETVLRVNGIDCAGSGLLFTYFLNRQDISEINGYLKFATRPRSGWVDVKIWYDPNKTDEDALIEAVTEPYYDQHEKRWRLSPFEVKGVKLPWEFD